MKAEAIKLENPLGDLPKGWRLDRLKNLCTKIGSGATPTGGQAAYLASRERHALVRSQNVFDRRFDEAGLAFITDQQAQGLRGVQLQENDLLLNITGDGITFGRACMVPKKTLPACVNQHVSIIRTDRNQVDPGFLLSFLTHPEIKSYVEGFNAGGSRRAITKAHIESFVVPVPPLPEQLAIARVLGALDDKIEVNREQNRVLEAMAAALFRSWFVDFDPVRAKAAGERTKADLCQTYRLPAAAFEALPTSFEDSALGPVPKGWEMKEVQDVIAALFDGPHATPATTDEGPVFLGIKNLTGTRLDLTDIRHISEAEFPRWTKRVTPRHLDIVFTYEATIGFFALMPPDLRCCLGRRLALVRAQAGTEHFLFHAFTAPAFQDLLDSRVWIGSTVNRIPLTEFPAYPLLWPGTELVKAFDKIVAPWWAMIHHNETESRALATLRDTLLPKLLSGEVRVAK